MKFRLFVIAMVVCWCAADYNPTDIGSLDLGSTVRHTLGTDMPEFPITVDDATS
jgi:hypothetical protein